MNDHLYTPWEKKERQFGDYPIGTEARSSQGGAAWTKTHLGWKTCGSATCPMPAGADEVRFPLEPAQIVSNLLREMRHAITCVVSGIPQAECLLPILQQAEEAMAHTYKPTDEDVDIYLDRVLRASGSALKHYTMQKSLDEMRAAMRAAMSFPAGKPQETETT